MHAMTWGRRLLAALAMAFLTAGAARADKKPVDEHGHETVRVDAPLDPHAGEANSTAFIDFPNKWDLSIYTVAVFLLLFVILKTFAWPNIVAGLKAREATIASAKEAAIAAKAEAEAASLRLNAEFASANDKIRGMLEEARRDADALRLKEKEAGQKEAAAERERAKREIDAAKDSALQEIYKHSVELATLISTKAVRRAMSADDHSRLVDEAIQELKPSRN